MNHNYNTQLQTRNITPRLSERGFSLIELMIAMTIGLVILAAVVQIFIRSHATSQLDEGMSRIQESARFAMDFLSKDIRMAGYMGCNSALFGVKNAAGDDVVKNNVDPPSASNTFSPGGMQGFRHACTTCTGGLADWDPPLPGAFFVANEVRPGSDVVLINRGSELSTTLTGSLSAPNANIQITEIAGVELNIAADDILMLSDCTGADIFMATNISHPGGADKFTIAHSSAGNTSPPQLSKAYEKDARLMKLVSRVYYVGGTADKPGLYFKEVGTGGVVTSGQLVSDVESMKILYGLATTTTSPAKYVVPASIADWTKVVSVRLGFIVRTPDTADAALDTNSYNLLDDTSSLLDDFDPVDDTRRRRVFNTTIRVRNH